MDKSELLSLMLTAIRLTIVLIIALLNLLLVGGYIYLLNKGDVAAAEMLAHYSGGAVFGEITAGVMYGLYSLLKNY